MNLGDHYNLPPAWHHFYSISLGHDMPSIIIFMQDHEISPFTPFLLNLVTWWKLIELLCVLLWMTNVIMIYLSVIFRWGKLNIPLGCFIIFIGQKTALKCAFQSQHCMSVNIRFLAFRFVELFATVERSFSLKWPSDWLTAGIAQVFTYFEQLITNEVLIWFVIVYQKSNESVPPFADWFL